MLVRDLLKTKTRAVITIVPEAVVARAMHLLLANRISCLPVVDSGGMLRGIISDKDIFRAAHDRDRDFKTIPVADLMTTDLIIGVLDDDIEYIAAVMTNNRIRHVPIIDDGRLANLLSIGDILKAQLRDLKVDNRYLRQYIDGAYPG
ncbi:MAG TPA: CBS domain-containing protein [candidate division Zixibacteria bacterium]|nr:CBS domain-containing protein [candidate division Zixibacteria bacterium]MDD4918224.1 CBS domain-containing protein [candidate division Zixibacteria bacterium]MDM7971604.1 CBS domain-containing protein [candidate division Zixibacteria bacterium]HOD66447.1 CBS domain-containing protein [candidate division Zixibacteria bacterium]HOZ08643.1 CBS domain-containing protein [candidate division Zixibacteria bacterium]